MVTEHAPLWMDCAVSELPGVTRCAGAPPESLDEAALAVVLGASRYRKRGAALCENTRTVRETVARDRIIDGIRQTLTSPEAVAYIRKHIGARLGALSREVDGELGERAARLARVEERIKNVIAMQVEGDRSPYLSEMRRDFEAQAASERGAVAELRARAGAPIRLPAIDELTRRVQGLNALFAEDGVERGREVLRRYLRGGAIRCVPEGERYMARAELLPLAMLLDGPQYQKLSTSSCAGRI